MVKTKSMKKGDAKALSISHPNSRKAKALAKKLVRTTARQKTKMDALLKRTLLINEKFMWFKENLEPCNEYTAPMLDRLFEKYLQRFDEELEQIKIKHSIGQRKGRQHASREDIIRMTQERESAEYNSCGMEMVDILNPKQLKQFKEWDGNPSVQFKIRRFSKSFLANYKPSNQPKPESPQMSVDDDDAKEILSESDKIKNDENMADEGD